VIKMNGLSRAPHDIFWLTAVAVFQGGSIPPDYIVYHLLTAETEMALLKLHVGARFTDLKKHRDFVRGMVNARADMHIGSRKIRVQWDDRTFCFWRVTVGGVLVELKEEDVR